MRREKNSVVQIITGNACSRLARRHSLRCARRDGPFVKQGNTTRGGWGGGWGEGWLGWQCRCGDRGNAQACNAVLWCYKAVLVPRSSQCQPHIIMQAGLV